jgi:TRAP-type C4-dicarboxylate transport system permease large subunit
MDALAMILLTLPIVFPVIIHFGFSSIWFGVTAALLSEVALIIPPVGMNSFVVHGVTKVPLHDVFRGVVPFFGVMLLGIAAFLPNVMK